MLKQKLHTYSVCCCDLSAGHVTRETEVTHSSTFHTASLSYSPEAVYPLPAIPTNLVSSTDTPLNHVTVSQAGAMTSRHNEGNAGLPIQVCSEHFSGYMYQYCAVIKHILTW